MNDAANVEAFQKLGVVPVSQSEAVATELARLVAGPVFQDILAQAAEDVTVARVVVTSASAQRPIQSIPELRGTLVVLVTRGRESVIPNGRTELRLGDIVTVFGSLNDLAVARGGPFRHPAAGPRRLLTRGARKRPAEAGRSRCAWGGVR